MHLQDLLQERHADFDIIRTDCDQFLIESDHHPVWRMLPRNYADIQRVKIRQHKRTDAVTRIFNEAFAELPNIRQRSLITSSQLPPNTNDLDPFYVFPINGYRFMYSREVKDSTLDYRHVIDVVFEQFDSENKAAEILSDIVKYSYVNKNLLEGICSGAEIIFYNIPYYYAVRCEAFPHYSNLISQL